MTLFARYWGSFAISAFFCLILNLYSYYTKGGGKSTSSSSSNNAKFQAFQWNYLIVYLLAMFSDWLQGPYVYELYHSYGFNQMEIAELFVCGFASSMIFGTFAGGLADKMGRKSMCITYSVLYILACFTKMVPDYWTLMLGRMLSGVCTSLLFSVFESWMVCEHNKRGFDSTWIGDTFAYSTFGNGFVAVFAGLVANAGAESYGYVTPFVIAIIPLLAVGIIITTSWSENHGNQQSNIFSSLQKGFDLVRRDSRVAALGLSQSCFEGAMYTFVFMWTPALKTKFEVAYATALQNEAKQLGSSNTADLNPGIEVTSDFLGLIFACYMISVMIGSSIFKIMSARRENLYKIPLFLHSIAFIAMGCTALFIDNKDIVYTMFLLFEITVGMFYPSYGVIKSEKIPEDIRSAVMNIFRIPLNMFVVFLLLKVESMTPVTVFTICTISHGMSLICYSYFYYNSMSKPSSVGEDDAKFEGKKTILYGSMSSDNLEGSDEKDSIKENV